MQNTNTDTAILEPKIFNQTAGLEQNQMSDTLLLDLSALGTCSGDFVHLGCLMVPEQGLNEHRLH